MDSTIRPTFKYALELFQQTIQKWNIDNVPRLAAALAYCATFSIAPLLVVIVAIGSSLLGRDDVRGQIIREISGVVGADSAQFIEKLVDGITLTRVGALASFLSILTLLLGAIGVFLQIKGSLNTIWQVTGRPSEGVLRDILAVFRMHLIGFLCVVLLGVFLVVSLTINAVLNSIAATLNDSLQNGGVVSFFQFLNQLVFFFLIASIMAVIFRVLPDTKVRWSDVRIGAVITSLLLMLGRLLIGAYLGSSAVASAYGAAGSLVILLLWVYYSSLIFLLGAEITYVVSRHRDVYRQKRMAALTPQTAPQPIMEEAILNDTPQLLSDSLKRIIHDFKNSITLIQGHAQLLDKQLASPSTSPLQTDIQEGIDQIKSSATEMRGGLDALRLFALIQNPPTIAEIDLKALLNAAWGQIGRLLSTLPIHLQIDEMPLPKLSADPEWVREVFTNIFRDVSVLVAEHGGTDERYLRITFGQIDEKWYVRLMLLPPIESPHPPLSQQINGLIIPQMFTQMGGEIEVILPGQVLVE